MNTCCICGYDTIQISPEFVKCVRCGHGFREFTGNAIEYHQNEFRKNHRRSSDEIDVDGRPTKLFHKNRKRIVKERYRLIKSYLTKEFTCLDVGAGGGTFAHLIRGKVRAIDCIEVESNLAAEIERLKLPISTQDFMDYAISDPFDIVFAWHTLEHVADCNAFLNKMLLSARHYVILEVPTARRVPESFDGHFHYFTTTSLRLALREENVLLTSEGVQKPAIFAVARGLAK